MIFISLTMMLTQCLRNMTLIILQIQYRISHRLIF